jgi:hypothetical protein
MGGRGGHDRIAIKLDLLERVLVLVFLQGAREVESSSLSPGGIVSVLPGP